MRPNVKANILENGFTTETINIEQSVKQGDALSCSLFILCMDPLIRKVNSDDEIVGLNIGINGECIDKVCGYADDIVFIIKECSSSIKKLFKTYYSFSKISGIELNTEKMEILRIGDEHIEKEYIIVDTDGNEIISKSIEAIKVCGITYSDNKELAYEKNITDKIMKLENQIKRWLWRGLSLEGKVLITKTFGLSQLIYFLQCCVMYPEDIIRVDRIVFKFLWNKKWDGKCPDRIQRQVLKNSYEMGGLKAPDMGALNSALKVKQFINATKSKNKINILQRVFTIRAAPISMTQMVYDSELCENVFIREALETIGKLNKIALDNYCKTLMKVRTQQADITSIKPYLEHFSSLTLKAYFTNYNTVTAILPMYINRNIITLGDMINEITYPTIAGGFLNNEVIKVRIPKQIFKGMDMCRLNGINIKFL